MSRWLIKYCNETNLEVFNLNILDCEDNCLELYRDIVREKYNYYLEAVSRGSKDEGSGYVYYNNSCLKIVEAEDIKEALTNFFF